MAGISLNAKVQDLNLNQPEFVRPVWEYLASAVSDARVKKGKDLIQANAPLFAQLEQNYGVSKEVLTAIWGMESAYGQSQGTFNLFEALATLAYDGPRAAYGRRQLIAALKVAEVEARDPTTMVGSWAGAFGETQFVPTTFLERAVDGDGDGKRDVWNSPADALASTANYLKLAGWRSGEPWGEEVELPADFPFDQADADIRKSESDWGTLGVQTMAGAPLSGETVRGWIFLPAGHRGPVFFIRENFDAILKYNLATSYALAVSLLADRFKDEGKIAAAWPVDESPLDQSSRFALQTGLNALGYMVGEPDGVLGRRSRQAIRDYQKDRGLPADGFATAALLTRILNEEYLKP
jgi:membrane-bound lytic murein transglycosylase B